ncbi:MAG: (Fe-S)-binding protein [Chloroflexi bacterium]|nr:(Fe-S)-binding protein [Chloroflexota bacterium]
MLTLPEMMLFVIAAALSVVFTWRGAARIVRQIGGGQGRPDWKAAIRRIPAVAARALTFQPVFRFRPIPSLFHALIGWGFLYFLLVNMVELAQGYFPGTRDLIEHLGLAGDLFRLFADISTTAVLAGIVAMEARRFILRPATLTARRETFLSPAARKGIKRDSAIVAVFIFVHISARLAGESMFLAGTGSGDPWQPVASTAARLWAGLAPQALVTGQHIAFWLSLGTILAFLPYFPYSKHIHMFFAPLNLWLKPQRRSIGELGRLDFDNPAVEQFGASRLADLGWEQVMDSYACIMCFRCQEVCPAYQTGKALSPAALEINKRYLLNHAGKSPLSQLRKDGAGGNIAPLPGAPLTESVIPEEAVWACTSCGACVDICPVGNEPMRDILDIRRSLVLMENAFPRQLETAFRGMERSLNPWGLPQAERMKWAEGLHVPTIAQNPRPDILWWVGCAPATDARAQKTAQAFAKILAAAGVDYAVLGRAEQCTGDSARRAGNEYLFNELANANVSLLNSVGPKRIVTTCPHCLHTLKNEYPAFGGNYEVIHHTRLINELVGAGKLQLEATPGDLRVTFHDPCYLGRHNRVFDEPRADLRAAGLVTVEMPRHAEKSFCCGAGGAQMWKEEEPGTENVNKARFAEAKAALQSAAGPSAGAGALAVGCPFCMTMLNDASKADGEAVKVMDVAEIVAKRLK